MLNGAFDELFGMSYSDELFGLDNWEDLEVSFNNNLMMLALMTCVCSELRLCVGL